MAFKYSLNSILGNFWGNYTAQGKTTPKIAPVSSDDKTVIAQIISEFKARNRAEIQSWRQALTQANHPTDPRLYALNDLYDNLQSDGHFISVRELRKAATLCGDFSITDRATGQIDNEKTSFFKEEWYYNLREDMLDHIFKGFTLIELTDTQKLEFKVVPRRNVAPALKRVYTEVAGNKFIDYSQLTDNRLIEVGRESNVGLMGDLCGLLIWKRNAMQAWAEFSEKYGQPLLTATTNKTAPADIAKIQTMLMELGEAARAVLPEGTTIKIDPFTGGDSFNVYDRQIERMNGEISKPIVGGTMTTDNGSSRSQSEVHERNLDEKIAARDKLMIEFITNGQIIPMLQAWGYPVNADTDVLRYESSFELTVKEHWDVVNSALEHFDIPVEWISKTFNIPIDGIKERVQPTINAAAINSKSEFKAGGFTANFR